MKNKSGHSEVVQRNVFKAQEVFGSRESGMSKELQCASALYWTKRRVTLQDWDSWMTSSHGELMKDSTIEAMAMLDFWL